MSKTGETPLPLQLEDSPNDLEEKALPELGQPVDEQLDGAQESQLERIVPLVGVEEGQEPATRAEKTLETNTAMLEFPHAGASKPIEAGEKTSSDDLGLEGTEDITLKKVEESSASDISGEVEVPGSDIASGPGTEVLESLAVGNAKPLREEGPRSEVLGDTPEPKALDLDDTPKEILDTPAKNPFENEVDSVPIIEKIPVADDAPIVEEVPIFEAMAVEEGPTTKEASEVEETTIIEKVPVIEIPAVEETSIFNEVAGGEEISILGVPIVEEVSVPEATGFKESPITDQALGVGEGPAIGEVPVIEVPAVEDTPIAKYVFEPEEATVVEEVSIIKVLDVEDTPIGKEALVLPVVVAGEHI